MEKKMKRKILFCALIILVMILSFAFSGCDAIKGLSSKAPEKYTEGIKIDRDFPDDIFEIYDDAIVFNSRNLFGEIVLSLGSEDDFDDIVDFYKDFFKDNEIALLSEDEDRDEYFARGVFKRYEFKIKIEEADGDYVEDLFESVVYLSAKEIKDADIKAPIAENASPGTSADPSTPAPQPTAAATPTPAADNSGETPLISLAPGVWELYGLYENGVELNSEVTIYFNEGNTGAFYYNDYDNDERGFYNFTYTLTPGVLELALNDGTVTYDAYYDDGILHLSMNEGTFNMYLANWSDLYSVYPSDDVFTAYGDWIYYEPETGYIETISFWPDGSGYVYNWAGTNESYFMYWAFENGIFTISDEMGNEYSYGIAHRGEVFELRQLNGSVFFYNRVSEKNWLTGTFYMDETHDESVDDWSMALYSDGTYEYTTNGTTTLSDWWINKVTGKMELLIGEIYFEFDYHYDLEGLHLWNSDSSLYYHFLQVG